jgi:hypothetical protein
MRQARHRATAVAALGIARSHDRRPWLRATAVATAGAVLLAEAATLVNRSDEPGRGPDYRTDSLQTAAIEATLGIVLILVVARTRRAPLQALAAATALAASPRST